MKRFERFATLRLPKHTPLILGVGLVFLVLLVFWVDTARLPYAANDFSYTADLNATDNYYDQQRQRYSGGRNSLARYSVTPLARDQDVVSVEASIEATTPDGVRVGGTKRVYGIDVESGKHVDDQGSHINEGYLFAPRGLEKGQSFVYQHVTYNAPATMEYKAEETIFGVKVYRYETSYADAVRVDVEDSNRTITPLSTGLEYEPHLTVWVEPTTGWMVKYEEDTTVYSYDRTTGQRISPVSRFASVFTESSIRQHAAYAQGLKYRLTFGQQIVPAILFIAILIGLLWIFVRRLKIKSLPIGLATGFVLFMSLASLAGWIFGITPLLALPAGGAGTNPMVSVCLVLAALCVQFIYRKILAPLGIVFASFIVIIAVLGMARAASLVGFDIDLLVLQQSVLSPPVGISGRMSLFEAFLLLLLGAGILKNFLPNKVAPFYFARLAAGLVVVLAAVGLLAKVLFLDDIFAVSFIRTLSVGTAILFIVSGAALLQVRLHYHDRQAGLRALGQAIGRSAFLAIPLVIIGIFAQVQQNTVKYQLQALFDAQVNAVQSAISSKIENYADVLVGEKALFAASQEVEESEWQAYVAALNLAEKNPGIVETGYAPIVSDTELRTFTHNARVDDQAYTVFPGGDRDVYAPVLYLTLPGGKNSPVVGFDLFSEAVRGEAIDRARDSGQPNLSSKMLQVGDNEPGFTLFAPVYSHGMPVDTVEQRRAAVTGYVFATFSTASLIKDVGTVAESDIVLQIYDGLKAEQDFVVYGQDPTPDFSSRLETSQTVYVANHPWTISYKARPSLQLSTTEERLPTYILFGGGVLYLLILVLIFWGRNLRVRIKENRTNVNRGHNERR